MDASGAANGLDIQWFILAFMGDLAQGACCLADGTTCTDNGTQIDCNVAGGTYLGVGTACAGINCLEGACCFATGFCLDLIEGDCTGAGGTFQGIGTQCATTVCPAP